MYSMVKFYLFQEYKADLLLSNYYSNPTLIDHE